MHTVDYCRIEVLRKVTLLGGSNSIHKNGMYKFLHQNTELTSLALGASSSLQNLYEVIRNGEVISQSDLIINESNVNDFHNHNIIGTTLSVIEKNIKRLYRRLASCGTKVIVVLLPLQTKRFNHADVINLIHLKYIEEFGLNYIDMHAYYKENELSELLYFDNLDHPLDGVMYQLAESIIKNIDMMNSSPNIEDNTNYSIFKLSERFHTSIKKNSLFRESVCEVDSKIKLPSKLINKKILGIHSWSDGNCVIKIQNSEQKWARGNNSEVQFHDLNQQLTIKNDTFLCKGIHSECTENSIRYPEKANSIIHNPKVIALFMIDEGSENKEDNESKKDNERKKTCYNSCLNFLVIEKEILTQYQQYKRSMGKFKKFIAAHRGNIIIELLFSVKRYMR